MEALTPEKLRRLALIRELFLRGIDESIRPEPLGSLSVLSFHDAIELFATLAAEHQGIALPRQIEFLDYWARVPGLAEKTAMNRLNAARVGLKHHGNFPSKLDVEGHRAAVTAFFNDSTREVFGVSFDEVSMVDLVSFIRTKTNIEAANRSAEAENWEDALACLAFAFHLLLGEFRAGSGTPPFSGWSNISASFSGDSAWAEDLNEAVSNLADDVSEQVARLEEAIEMVALGIDLTRWQQFKRWTPWVKANPEDDTLRYQFGNRARRLSLGRDQFEFCRRFVVDSALRHQRPSG